MSIPSGTDLAVLVIFILIHGCVSGLPVINLAVKPVHDVDRVCHNAGYTLYNAYASLGLKGEFLVEGITTKPAKVPVDSPCYGMSGTCCLRSNEKSMVPVVQLEYHNKLEEALKKRLTSCGTMGRRFERALFYSFRESHDLLRTEISGIVNVKQLPQYLFNELFNFLYQSIHTQDFCELSEKVKDQMEKIFRYVFQQQIRQTGSENLSEHCTAIVEDHFVNTWFNTTLDNFVRALNTLRLVAEIMDATQALIHFAHQHKFHETCVNALFKIKHCAYCGGYSIIEPCDGNCINTLRGCMADLAELKPYIHLLKIKLKEIGHLASTELEPLRFLKTTLIDFIYLTTHLVQSNITKLVQSDSCEVLDDTKIHQIESNNLLHHIKSSVPSAGIIEAINSEMSCFDGLESAILELPEEICGIDPKHLSYIRNKDCWNGTERANYNEAIVEPMKANQVNNPAFKSHPLPLENSYSHITSLINTLLHEVNMTNEFYECIQTDDEDCSVFVLECESSIEPNEDSASSGSGSGSDSGSRSGSGFYHTKQHESSSYDLESPNRRPFIIQFGPPRRYHDNMNDEPKSNTTEPLPTDHTPQSTEDTTNENEYYKPDSEIINSTNGDAPTIDVITVTMTATDEEATDSDSDQDSPDTDPNLPDSDQNPTDPDQNQNPFDPLESSPEPDKNIDLTPHTGSGYSLQCSIILVIVLSFMYVFFY